MFQCAGVDAAREQTATALKQLPEIKETLDLGIRREGEGVNGDWNETLYQWFVTLCS